MTARKEEGVFMWGCHWTVRRHALRTDMTTYHRSAAFRGRFGQVASFWWASLGAVPTSSPRARRCRSPVLRGGSSESREIGNQLCRGLAIARGVVPAYLTLGIDQDQM